MITRGLIKKTLQHFKMQYLDWHSGASGIYCKAALLSLLFLAHQAHLALHSKASGRGKIRMQAPGAVVEQCPGPPW